MIDPIRVLVVDDQPTVRQGLRLHLSCVPDIEIAGEAGDGDQAISLAHELEPDVIVMDISMPGIDGFAATRAIRDQGGAPVVMLSLRDDESSRSRAIDAGAAAFVSKNEATGLLVEAIRRVVAAGEADPAWIDPGQVSTGGA